MLDHVRGRAARKGATPAQFAIAWTMARAPWIVPIPGTTVFPHMVENLGAMSISLTDAELREFDDGFARLPISGARADPFTESQFDHG